MKRSEKEKEKPKSIPLKPTIALDEDNISHLKDTKIAVEISALEVSEETIDPFVTNLEDKKDELELMFSGDMKSARPIGKSERVVSVDHGGQSEDQSPKPNQKEPQRESTENQADQSYSSSQVLPEELEQHEQHEQVEESSESEDSNQSEEPDEPEEPEEPIVEAPQPIENEEMSIFVVLYDNQGPIAGGKKEIKCNSLDTLEHLKQIVSERFKIHIDNQQLCDANGVEFFGLGNTLHSHNIKANDELILKHVHLKKWELYKQYVDIVLKPTIAPNQMELVEEASNLNKTLNESNFFEAYDDFREYRNRYNWRVVKFKDADVSVISAAAREHFLNLHGLQGGSTHDFYFKYKPKESSGSRCGITCKVGLKEQRVKWQVKTHHNGGSSFKLAASGPDIRELYCYKLFELIGVGPKVQFVLPSKDLGSKTAVYICTEWRTDFKEFAPEKGEELNPSEEALVQLHLLQLILGVEDLHGLNCGQWENTTNLAIVDFCMGTAEREVTKKHFCNEPNKKITWSKKAEPIFNEMSRDNFMIWANKWLTEDWSFMANLGEANTLLAQVKNNLKNEHQTKFRGFNVDEDDQMCSNQVTDDLQEYINRVKENATIFLSP